MDGYEWLAGDSEECDCDKCRQMCTRPCWPLPEEIEAIINAGFGSRLMLDYWVGGINGDIGIVSPAITGSEGQRAPYWPVGNCTFSKNGLCELHGVCKPYEGRIAHHSGSPDHHENVAMAWDTELGNSVVNKWMDDFSR